MQADRRTSNRCEVQFDEIQVAVHPSRKLYPIKDISSGGLAIEYNPSTDEFSETNAVDLIAIEYDRF